MNQVNKAKSTRFTKTSTFRHIDNVTKSIDNQSSTSPDKFFIESIDLTDGPTDGPTDCLIPDIAENSLESIKTDIIVVDRRLHPLGVEPDEDTIKKNKQINPIDHNDSNGYLKRINTYANCIDGYRR